MAEDMRVKICGLMRREDAVAADVAGVDYLGVVVSSGFGRSVAATAARAIVDGTRARKVAVVVDESADSAEAAAREMGADVIQLHGEETPDVLEALRSRGTWAIWKAVRARSLHDVERAVARYRASADGLLVEGWKEGSVGGGGARVALEGSLVREIVPTDLDFVLAGGLDPDSVGDAVRRFRPDVVDVSSGVEHTAGQKEHDLVRAFVDAARAAEPVSEAEDPSEEDAIR